MICDYKIFEDVYYSEIANERDESPDEYIVDCTLVNSIEVSEGTGRNPTDRGRKGIKILFIAGRNKIPYRIRIVPANKSDVKTFESVITEETFDNIW